MYYVRSDHIGKPVFATGAKVWEATYLPFGGVHTSTGANINLRFPGQWFQSESGLHQNWMRDYDPTTGRYIQADPLGLVDGASVYGYVWQNPNRYTDPTGEQSISIGGGFSPPGGLGSSRPADIGGAWGELLEFSHNYNPIDLLFQEIGEMCTPDGPSCTDHFEMCVASGLGSSSPGPNWGMSDCGACLSKCVADGGNWPDYLPGYDRCDYWNFPGHR